MDEVDSTFGPQTSFPVLLVATAIHAILLLLLLRRSNSPSERFLTTAIWLRVTSGAYHFFMYAPIAGGFTPNALLSVATVALGPLFVNQKTFAQRWIAPIYMLLFVLLLSSIVNGVGGGAIDMAFKWGYTIVIIAAARQAMLESGPGRVLTDITYCYCLIFALQAYSVVAGGAKVTEGDVGESYIGGYAHESGFSLMAATALMSVYLNRQIKPGARAIFMIIGIASFLLANYRTAIIALIPMLFGYVLFDVIPQFNTKSRGFLVAIGIPLAVALAVVIATFSADRYADLGKILSNTDVLFKAPDEFTADERHILSSRLYIWSNYIHAYRQGSDIQLLIGFGPNSWHNFFKLYAHNTLVSYLYELGVAGVVSLLFIWGSFIVATLHVADGYMRGKLLLAQLSFLLLNLATMPHWQIEGTILFALIQGTLLFNLNPEEARRSTDAGMQLEKVGLAVR